jgi:hypothetical protein
MGPSAVTQPIPPGTKARLTQPDDARRFGVKVDAPLLDWAVGSVSGDDGRAEGANTADGAPDAFTLGDA